MAGTHEENMKDPAWLTEQLKQAKAQRDALQEKHDAQLAGIAEDKKTIASLNDALAAAAVQRDHLIEVGDGLNKRIAQKESRIDELTEALKTSHAQTEAETERANAAVALAKSRRAAHAEIAAISNRVLAGE